MSDNLNTILTLNDYLVHTVQEYISWNDIVSCMPYDFVNGER